MLLVRSSIIAILLLTAHLLRAADQVEDSGAIGSIVAAFGPTALSGRMLNAIIRTKTDERWIFRGAPFAVGCRYAEVEGPMGSVVTSVRIYEGTHPGESSALT